MQNISFSASSKIRTTTVHAREPFSTTSSQMKILIKQSISTSQYVQAPPTNNLNGPLSDTQSTQWMQVNPHLKGLWLMGCQRCGMGARICLVFLVSDTTTIVDARAQELQHLISQVVWLFILFQVCTQSISPRQYMGSHQSCQGNTSTDGDWWSSLQVWSCTSEKCRWSY